MIGGDLGRRKAASSVLPSSSAAYDPKRHTARASNSDSALCVIAVFVVTVFVVWLTRSGGSTASTTADKIAVVATPEVAAESQPPVAANIAVGALEIDHSTRTVVDAQGIAAAAAAASVAEAAAAADDATNSPAKTEDRNSAGWRKRESKERLKAKARAEAAATAAALAQAEKDKQTLKPPVIVSSSDLSLREQILKNAAVGGSPPHPPLERQKAFTSLPDAAKGPSDDDEVDAADFMPSVGAKSAAVSMDALPPLVPVVAPTPMVTTDKAGEGVEMASLADYSQPGAAKPDLQRKPAVQGDAQAKEAARIAKEAALAKDELALRSGTGKRDAAAAAAAAADKPLQQRMSDGKPAAASPSSSRTSAAPVSAAAVSSSSDEIAPEYVDEAEEQGGADGDAEDADGSEGLFEDGAGGADESDELETREQLAAALAAAIKRGRKALKGAKAGNKKNNIAVNKQASSGSSKGSKGKKAKSKKRAAKKAKRQRRRQAANQQLHRPGSSLPRSNYAQTKRQELLAKARAATAEADEEAAHEL